MPETSNTMRQIAQRFVASIREYPHSADLEYVFQDIYESVERRIRGKYKKLSKHAIKSFIYAVHESDFINTFRAVRVAASLAKESDHTTPREVFREALRESYEYSSDMLLRQLLSSPYTPGKSIKDFVLDVLENDGSLDGVVVEAICNGSINSPARVLRIAWEHIKKYNENSPFRAILAFKIIEHRNVSSSVAEEIYEDYIHKTTQVAISAAKNPELPYELIERAVADLCKKDTNNRDHVSFALQSHVSRWSPYALYVFVRDYLMDNPEYVRVASYIAASFRASDALALLYHHPNRAVKLALARNVSAPKEVLVKLSKNKDLEISRAAKVALSYKEIQQ